MNLLDFFWLILTFFCIIFGLKFLFMYFKDKDLRKLMFSIGFFCNLVTYVYILFGYHRIDFINVSLYGLFGWGPSPLIVALFFAICDRLFNFRNKLKILFKIYLIIIFVSLIIFSSGIISPNYFTYYMLSLSSIILIFSVFLIIKYKDLTSVLFLLSQIFFSISGYTLGSLKNNIYNFSELFPIMSFFVAYIFLYLIFAKSDERIIDYSTKSLFSIEKKLEKSEKERKEALSRYKALFNSHNDLIYIYDFSGNFLDANEGSLKITGYTRDEITKLNFKDFLDKGQLLKAFKLLREVKKYGFQKKPEEFRIKCKNGEMIDIDVMSSLIYEGRTPVAIQGIARDISDRKNSERELEKLASIVKHSSELVNLATLDGKMIFLNEAGSKMLGIDPKRVGEYNIMQVIPEHLTNLVKKDLLPSLLNKGIWEGDLQFKNIINGKLVDVSAMTFTIYEPKTNKPLYLANVSLDITNRKKAEIELKNARDKLSTLNKELELKVRERTSRIEQLLKQKDEFINQLGHDLKNPLSPLVNLLPMMENEESDPQKKEMLHIINRNVRYMRDLVIKTIELAQLNSPNTKFSFTTVNLKEESDSIIKNNQLLFDEKNINVVNEIVDDFYVKADMLHLDELFTNLLNNAVKYSPENSKIVLSAKEKNNDIIVTIKDSGIGMSKKQLSHVFDEFYKADDSRHDFDSSGLGMPICKRIVEHHGGQIWAESSGIGKGSTIFFSLQKESKNNINENSNQNDISGKVDRLLKKHLKK